MMYAEAIEAGVGQSGNCRTWLRRMWSFEFLGGGRELMDEDDSVNSTVTNNQHSVSYSNAP